MSAMPERAERTVLGFDYGAKRIGVAVGQELTRTATPLETIPVKDGKPAWECITRLIEVWQPQALVVGLPLNADGTEHTVSRAARRFAYRLHGRYNLPVHTIDEQLTSVMAEHASPPAVRRAGRGVDPVAAQYILQTWLEHTRRSNP